MDLSYTDTKTEYVVLDKPENRKPNRLFAVDIDAAFFNEFTGQVLPGSAVARNVALTVPAIKKSRDVIAGGIGQLPLKMYGANGKPAPKDFGRLVAQPEKGLATVVTMTRTVEDLLLDGVAFWHIKEYGWHKFPVWVERLTVSEITTNDDGSVTYKGKKIPAKDLIRFDSPNGPLLRDGAKAIQALLALNKSALMRAQGIPPVEYFKPTDAYNMNEEELTAFLQAWKTARLNGTTAYIPDGLEYVVVGHNAEQSQLGNAKDYQVVEVARLAGLDPEYLGVSTTSRTYANMYDRRKFLVDFTLNPYLIAIEQRLSLNDVTPNGSYTKFSVDAFLRGSTTERYAAHKTAIEIDLYDVEHARELEDLPVNGQ